MPEPDAPRPASDTPAPAERPAEPPVGPAEGGPAEQPAERVELAKPVRSDAGSDLGSDAGSDAEPGTGAAASAAGEPAPEAPPVEAPPTATAPAGAPVAGVPAPPVDPWAAPAAFGPALPPPGAPLPPGAPVPPGPQATGWAAVTPGAVSGFQPGYAYPQAPAVTNGFAVAALITGLLCMWPLSVAFAITALVQIPKRNERGRGMAVAALLLSAGVVVVAATAVLVLGNTVDTADGDRPGRVPKAPPGAVHWGSLKSGDCYNQPGGSAEDDAEGGDQTVYWVLKVPCLIPHQGEVAGTTRIPASDSPAYPGETKVREDAARLCGPVLDEYALDSWAVPDGMDEVYLYPGRGNWKAGERYVTCAYEDRDGQHRGSVRTDRGSLTAAQLTYLEAARAFNTASANEPDAEIADARPEYWSWAGQMAAASRKEAEDLSKGSTIWPEGAKPKLAEMVAGKREAAAAWDTVVKTVDATALEREVRRAKALEAKAGKQVVEIRRELGLSTGEQAGEARA
ncbi:septum formation family protein [Kitasatospora sp. NPDC048239]|uniref:DUF4190 domain-containing protein n=1 Tax=Kitasatospora sp. NPDC048239 TaxID=3364046 RepID=UPI00372409B0